MAANDVFIRGEDGVLRFYQQAGGAMRSVYIPTKNFKVTENATEVADGVNGENRDRLDKVTNFYDCSFDIYIGDMDFMTSYIEAQNELDSNHLPLKQSFAVLLKHPKKNYAYLCQEAMVGPIDMNVSGRADAVMVSVKARFRFFRPVASI